MSRKGAELKKEKKKKKKHATLIAWQELYNYITITDFKTFFFITDCTFKARTGLLKYTQLFFV